MIGLVVGIATMFIRRWAREPWYHHTDKRIKHDSREFKSLSQVLRVLWNISYLLEHSENFNLKTIVKTLWKVSHDLEVEALASKALFSSSQEERSEAQRKLQQMKGDRAKKALDQVDPLHEGNSIALSSLNTGSEARAIDAAKQRSVNRRRTGRYSRAKSSKEAITPQNSATIQTFVNLKMEGQVTDNKGQNDIYQVGQAGAVGPNSSASDNTFNQIWVNNREDIDLEKLANDLSVLRTSLRKHAIEPEQDIEIASLAMAEKAAQQGDGPKALQHLSKVGKWVLDAAKQIGIEVAVQAINKSTGLS